MRGKKSRLMRCGCCECRDLRAEVIEKMVKKEVRAALAEKEDGDLRYFGEVPL